MSKKEVWKLISFKGKKPSVPYAVSNQGRFGVMFGKKGNVAVRQLQAQPSGHRYNYKVKGKSVALFVHKEVAKAFVRQASPRHNMVIRLDHDYLNDSADNLRWVTAEQHKQHVTFSPNSVKARQTKGIVISPTAKVFDEKKVRLVKEMIWDPKRKLTYKQIAKKFGVSEMQIYRIKSGELWYHVKVDNEPVNDRYTQNLKNIALLEKKGKPKSVKRQVEKARKELKKLSKKKSKK